MKLHSISIRSRIILLVATALVCLAAVVGYLAMLQRNQMLADRQANTRNIAEFAYSLLKHYDALVKSGQLTLAEAQDEARKSLGSLRYDGDNYLYVIDTEANMVLHPVKPGLNGKNLADFKDSQGTPLFINIVDVAKRGSNETTEYLWPKPGYANPVRKAASSKLFAPWGWVVSTGIYLDDVDAEFMDYVFVTGTSVAGAAILLLVFSCLALRSITRLPSAAEDVPTRISEGDPTVRVESDSKDEVGRLANAVQATVGNLTQTIGELRSAADNLSNAAGQVLATPRLPSKQTPSVEGVAQSTGNAVVDEAAALARPEMKS